MAARKKKLKTRSQVFETRKAQAMKNGSVAVQPYWQEIEPHHNGPGKDLRLSQQINKSNINITGILEFHTRTVWRNFKMVRDLLLHIVLAEIYKITPF